ncbi:hypothetical protein OE88DRAFT_465674 [Heliocybe sulcata]|uniref:Chromo domain-containing protein n=1 Tax=Heliocybe sulcata TaxID=5364 RepID=A0A5C3MW40_9AGAM|nr:hypothetical protein OE88DRAFT_465674 [Heliocybe sulcata]
MLSSESSKILDQYAAELHLKSFAGEPSKPISPYRLDSCSSPVQYSLPESLVPVSWSSDGSPSDAASLTAASSPRVSSPDRIADDKESLKTLDFNDSATEPELEKEPLTSLFSLKSEEEVLRTYDNGLHSLPSPPGTHLDSSSVVPSRPSSPLSPDEDQSIMSPSRSLTPLSDLSSLSGIEDDKDNDLMSAAVANNHKEAFNKPQVSMGTMRKSEGTFQGEKRRGKNGNGQGPTKRRKSQAKSAKIINDSDVEAGPSQPCCNQGWPPILSHDRDFHRKLIQCDNCDTYYHYGCVGIVKGDKRLERGEIFLCPPCASAPVEQRLWRRGSTKDAEQSGNCARHGCGQTDTNDDEYFVERIIGRRPRLEGAGFMWLIKWDGYPVKEATWSTDEDIGEADNLIADFENAVQRQKLHVRPQQVILLKEAVDGGWKA